MSHDHEVQRLAIYLRVFLNVLSRYLSCPMRLVHRLFHCLLQKYSRVTSTQLQVQPIHRDGPSDRVVGSSSSHSILPQHNNQLQVPSPPGPSSNSSLPTSSPSTAPPSSPSTTTPSSNHALQPPSADPVEFQPFTPSEVRRYNKDPSM
jgi:hypothetical protein